jgi:OFA family oxalate/formate antiporter-like MFS transporter
MGGIYGWVLLAWGAAAIPSPIMIARLHQSTGSFSTAVYIIAGVMVCSLVLPLIAKRPNRDAKVLSPQESAVRAS